MKNRNEIIRKARNCFFSGRFSEAAKILEDEAKDFPNDYGLQANLFFLCVANGEDQKAKEIFDRIIQESPDSLFPQASESIFLFPAPA